MSHVVSFNHKSVSLMDMSIVLVPWIHVCPTDLGLDRVDTSQATPGLEAYIHEYKACQHLDLEAK